MFGFSLSFQDWCIFIGTVATVILVVYAALERHIPKGRAPVAKPQRSGRASQADPAPTSRRLTIPIILAAVAWIAVAADFTDRHWISGRGTVPLSARTEAPAAPSMPAPPLSMSPAPQAAPRIIVDVTPEYLMDLYKDRMTVQGDALFAPYKSKWMKLSGPAGNITSGGGPWGISVFFALDPGPNSGKIVELFFDDKWKDSLAVLRKGQKISALCQIADAASGLILRVTSCELLSEH